MVRRTKENAEQTRNAILDSALDLFYEKGFTRTTFDEIAKRIELTKGAVYWHFRNKADLLTALIKYMVYKHHNVPEQDAERLSFFIEVQPFTSLYELKQSFMNEAILIESRENYRKFLFFVLFQMEWSETMIAKISGEIKDIRDFPIKQIKQTLTFLQKSGEISSTVDINVASAIFCCIWRGALSSYISKEYEFNLSKVINKSFDLVVNVLK